ncbi:hypothetical protein PRIPAC_75960 [Pristionchus pacificus]|uniref:Uncharacterized protein n=1 Tax=Pristionchus pacificus TaxID=54126 RepID=A0A2A6CRW1_PRIPA|nr:hypothetical protein PRIPAC_75960 [Pristionchus pacificus]|eukprot:PDM80860.1 hypothetical protein PRIPAC_35863 [Pristionchus pacificus]
MADCDAIENNSMSEEMECMERITKENMNPAKKPYWEYIIAGIRNEESTMQQRQKAFKSFIELYDDMMVLELDETFYKEVMLACIDYIASRENSTDMSYAESTKLCNVMKDCFEDMDRLVRESIALSMLLSHEKVFPWIFDRNLSVDNKQHDAYSLFLAMLLNWTEPSERVTIFIRYYGRLRNAIMGYTIYKWVQRWIPKDLDHNTERFEEYWNECFVVVKVLKSALIIEESLQKSS